MQTNEETEEQKMIRLASIHGRVGRHRESDGTLPGWKEWSKRHIHRNERVHVCQGRKQWRKQMWRHQRSDGTLSLVSWNILSNVWLDDGNAGYEWTPIELKSDWSTRLALIMKWVDDLQPDVLFFQEVDYKRFDDSDGSKGPFLLTELSKFGYHGVIQRRKRGNKAFEQPCFVATFWKDDQFELIKEKSFSRAMSVILKCRSSATNFCLGNVHLESKQSAEGSDKRARQLNSVLSYVAREAPGIPFALAGDFNTGSDSAIFKVLRDLEWHGHAMSSVYEHPSTRNTLPMCHATYVVPGAHYSIDHILYSHSSLKMRCVLDPLNSQEKQEHVLKTGMASGFPNMFCPSDHIPIGVILEFEQTDQNSETLPLTELTKARGKELRAQWNELQAQKPTFSKGIPSPDELEERRKYARAVKAWKASIPKENVQEMQFVKQL